jgi:hypothetical protein
MCGGVHIPVAEGGVANEAEAVSLPKLRILAIEWWP